MNKRYARIYEDAVERRGEVTNEEFWIYLLIVLHSYVNDDGMRICEKSVHELCALHNLEYHNTSRRLMRLRTGTFAQKEPVKKVAPMKTPWVYKTKKGYFLPLVGIKEIVKNTIFMEREIVKNTNSNCKKYKKSARKIVKNTSPLNPYLQTSLNNSLNNSLGERERGNSNGHKSIFSLDECLRYVGALKSEGATIRNPNAYAMTLYKSGESDAFIQAKLYPEAPAEIPDDDARRDALKLLLDVKNSGEDVFEYKHWYSEEDWQWLMSHLAD